MAAKPKPTGLVQGITVALKPGEYHAHGCTQCSSRYGDACLTPGADGRCAKCRGRERPLWERDFDPRPCCRTDSRPATKEQVASHKLGGAREWFRCKTCARTHPYSPSGRGRT